MNRNDSSELAHQMNHPTDLLQRIIQIYLLILTFQKLPVTHI